MSLGPHGREPRVETSELSWIALLRMWIWFVAKDTACPHKRQTARRR